MRGEERVPTALGAAPANSIAHGLFHRVRLLWGLVAPHSALLFSQVLQLG